MWASAPPLTCCDPAQVPPLPSPVSVLPSAECTQFLTLEAPFPRSHPQPLWLTTFCHPSIGSEEEAFLRHSLPPPTWLDPISWGLLQGPLGPCSPRTMGHNDTIVGGSFQRTQSSLMEEYWIWGEKVEQGGGQPEGNRLYLLDTYKYEVSYTGIV